MFNLKKQVIKHQKTSKPKTEKKACGIKKKKKKSIKKFIRKYEIADYKTK